MADHKENKAAFTPPVGFPKENPKKTSDVSRKIAVVGISGRFPGANNTAEFWENLKYGIDSVTEVPKSRWDTEEYFDEDPKTPNKTYSKWSGLIPDVDQFDPQFFHISPREAELMDPQQRVFLEEAWKALEDAGYPPESLSNRKCGVFAGVASGDYASLLKLSGVETDAQFLTGNQASILAARISYFLNLTGPSMAIDTACSSSLVAVHQACSSILNGESEVAIAGGVCIFTTPEIFIMASKGEMLAKDGRCKAFDNDGDGFVPSEGAGVVILKPLERAILDRDHIYGVITGSGINQDGKTNGITAPSANSQYLLETGVYSDFGIDPSHITYIETHGTGTKLGDPIEFSALKKAFRDFTDQIQYCAIGSVKTNIGHSITASGIASLIKTLLCMKYKKLVPSLHFNTPNEHIDFSDSPFYVNTRLKDWEIPGGWLRTAAVSSFGLSGTNCHMVVEEYTLAEENRRDHNPPYYLMLFSAKKINVLKEKLRQTLTWISEAEEAENLFAISYMLAKGRSHFPSRMAFVVESLEDFRQKLLSVLEHGFAGDCFSSEESKNNLDITKNEFSNLLELAADDAGYHQEAYKQALLKLGRLYAARYAFDWNSLYGTECCLTRISMPAYPFERNRYWVPAKREREKEPVSLPAKRQKLYPLIGQNESTFREGKFSNIVSGQEFYMENHKVFGKKTLPGVVYLEMARAAAEIAAERSIRSLEDVTWIKPFCLDEGDKEIGISLLPNENGSLFEIYSASDNDKKVVHCRGNIIFEEKDIQKKNVFLDIEKIQSRLEKISDIDACYEFYAGTGVTHGTGMRSMREIWADRTEVLAKVEIPESLEQEKDGYVLHPALMDGALQAVIGLMAKKDAGVTYLPYRIGKLSLEDNPGQTCYVYIQCSTEGDKAYDIRILDGSGKVQVSISQYTIMPVNSLAVNRSNTNDASARKVLYFKNQWVESEAEPEPTKPIQGSIIVFAYDRYLYNELTANGNYESAPILVLAGETFEQESDCVYHVNPASIMDYNKLFDAILTIKHILLNIVYCWTGDKAYFTGDDPQHPVFQTILPLFHLTKGLIQRKWNDEVRLLYMHEIGECGPRPQDEAVSAFAKSLVWEKPGFFYQTVGYLTDRNGVYRRLADIVLKQLADGCGNYEVKYTDYKKYIRQMEEFKPGTQDSMQAHLSDAGVYLITGGLGGLGIIIAQYLVQRPGVHVILCGRSALSPSMSETLAKLQSKTAALHYMQADISKHDEVEKLLIGIKERFGRLNGVIHSAGVIRDSYFLKKSEKDFLEVLAPKVNGAILLDRATQNEALDFFVLFSAVASVTGNYGQSDYAYANGFLDQFAFWRNELVSRGDRRGRTVSINWPYWEEGGMRVDTNTLELLERKMGMLPLRTKHGLAAFESALQSGLNQIAVIEGQENKIRPAIGNAGTYKQQETRTYGMDMENGTDDLFFEKTGQYLRNIFSKVIKLPPEMIEDNEPFETYGLDSVMIVTMNRELAEHFQDLSKTLLFEYKNLRELTEYFVENHKQRLIDKFKINSAQPFPQQSVPTGLFTDKKPELTVEASDKNLNHDIAIIGVAGRYPQADNIDMFWENLLYGVDCITEIPPERWNHSTYFNPEKGVKGKCCSKWGGFIHDYDKFDPLFFHISPRDAQIMDPQERLFLETVWEAVEDAGYTKAQLGGKSIGVYTGVMYGHYSFYGVEESMKGNVCAANSNFSSIANRVSYYFDFRGPSIAVDTMCSSSLTAIHMACQAMLAGEVEMAVAGGVNLSLHPNKYILLSQGNFLSSDGRCSSFGEGGDGYVPGEGVGAVILKPFMKAVEDQDNIYGVIKATALNHGGKTNGFTVPNPSAQAEVISKAIEKSNIDPRTIQYIEAHGTGTSLGDSIEITGLIQSIGKGIEEKQFCAIGSVKSNIGHLESAAGIAGLTKVLLQIRHKTIVPSIHAGTINPNINFAKSPVYLQREARYWEKPVISEGKSERAYPRRAGISAFGAGGSNAHMIVEEYEVHEKMTLMDKNPQIIVLSARSKERLIAYTHRLLTYLEKSCGDKAETGNGISAIPGQVIKDVIQMISEILSIHETEIHQTENLSSYTDDAVKLVALANAINEKYGLDMERTLLYDNPAVESIADHLYNQAVHGKKDSIGESGIRLEDIAYTLQTGREAMEERLAFVACDLEDLKDKLERSLVAKNGFDDIYRGSVKIKKAVSYMPAGGIAGKEFLNTAESDNGYEAIARLWSSGAEIQWGQLHEGYTPRRIHLPTYPFTKKTCWISAIDSGDVMPPDAGTKTLHADKPANNSQEDIYQRMPLDLVKKIREYNGNEVSLEIIEGSIALVTIADRENKNQLTEDVIAGLMAAFTSINNDSRIKAVVVTGYDNVFCMGGTKDQLLRISNRQNSFMDTPFIYRGLLECNVPVIAAMQGHASGGGMMFGLYADIVIMSHESVYTASFMKYGFTPGMGATFILGEKLGNNLAVEMMYTASPFSGADLKSRGASVIFKDRADVLSEALSIAKKLAEKPAGSLKLLKQEFSQRYLSVLMDYIEREDEMHAISFVHPEVKEKINEFYTYPGNETHEHRNVTHETVPAAMPQALKPVNGMPEDNSSPASDRKIPFYGDSVKKQVAEIVANILRLQPGEAEYDISFNDLGVDSISGVEIIRDVNKLYGLDLDVTAIFDHSTVNDLTHYILNQNSGSEAESGSQPAYTSRNPKAGESGKDTVIPYRSSGRKIKLHDGIQDEEKSDEPNQPAPKIQIEPLSKTKINCIPAEESVRTNSLDIAIVGMSGRYPGANDLKQYWTNLANGVSSITEVPKKRWDIDRFYDSDPFAPNKTYCRHGGFLQDIDKFDPLFFNISPKEAIAMDPQQRLFLEECWKAIEDAGYSDRCLSRAKCGVFVGASSGEYGKLMSDANYDGGVHSFTGLSSSILAARISYILNLTGPSIAMDTACSSSLVAIHQACQSIISGECDIALAGGVVLMLTPDLFIKCSKVGMLTAQGNCRAFDQNADGIVIGEGVGVVVLKALDKAIRDKDHIYGVIKGSGVNQDGKTNGLTAPSAASQASLEYEVYKKFGINPEKISYIEAHGTGTKLGDPIEIKALNETFAKFTSKKQFCAIGSVKNNIGHTTMAAGVAGVMKVLLSMKYKKLTPLIHFETENEHIRFNETAFYVNNQLTDWTVKDESPRMAAVSAFGFSGTNCHMVIEEYKK
ncbi:SDR family NAD(P)-dependent oxidoreductase [Lachnospiraceae bacterium 54-53]